ncbi:hypothetical protein QQ008_05455 [Fulvivirgaceae bacterium BMA10]|uniref:Uncharacterized protein n=1 Tax=Splendidivirga corallicola TaxID=3051826 RepID=A0ABT8KL93_9BACT|nr:hypothetical protein [Fulvivirgaceae bacterium BMA10]
MCHIFIYDGILDEKRKSVQETSPYHGICITNNKNASFANIDAENGFKNIDRDISKYDCSLPSLKKVVLTLEN